VSFSQFLPLIDPGQYPDVALLSEVGRALRGHLKRMALWEYPPSFLGYPDYHSWRAVFAVGDAEAAPTLDCYLEAIVRRYAALMLQLARKDNIDGLVHLNIKRFILERQKNCDPVGYAVFKNVQTTLQDLVASGVLHPVSPDPRGQFKVGNQTVLTFAPGPAAAPVSAGTLEAALDRAQEWEQALPRLAKLGKGAQRFLGACIRSLAGSEVGTFRVGDLVGLLKDRSREAYARRNVSAGQEMVTENVGDGAVRGLIRTVRPDLGYEEARESLQSLLRCVEQGIAEQSFQERTREGLRRLVQELRQHAESDEEIPSWAELARQLGARKATLWDHVEKLRALVQECQKDS
jgi:hypothetical protein